MSGRLELLRNSLVVLAADSATQLEHLHKLGLPEGVDELALEYDDTAAAAGDMLRCRELDKSLYDAVKHLHSLLAGMSGKTNAYLWTPSALSVAPEWKEVRTQAKECLRLLDRNPQDPAS